MRTNQEEGKILENDQIINKTTPRCFRTFNQMTKSSELGLHFMRKLVICDKNDQYYDDNMTYGT